MNDHHQKVIDGLRGWKPGEGRLDPRLMRQVGIEAEEANRSRFAASIREMGASLPFRRDDRSRDKRIADVLRLARLTADNRTRRSPHRDGDPQPNPWSSGCGNGWSSVVRPGDGHYPGGSPLVEKPAISALPPDQHLGYSGTSARAFANNNSITIGAAIGEFCDIVWTPQDQRIQMGAYEGATISTSLFTFYQLQQPLSVRAPNALMAKAEVLRSDALSYMVAGDPNSGGGGLVWCYATCSLDVYLGLNLTGTAKLPHASTETCLWNRMGSGFFDYTASNGVNGNWDTKVDIFDDGDVSNPVLIASLGGTGTSDTIILVNVSVNVCCLRYPGDDGFVGVTFQDPMSDPLVITPDSTFQKDSGLIAQTSPIQLQSISLCGI